MEKKNLDSLANQFKPIFSKNYSSGWAGQALGHEELTNQSLKNS